MFLKRLTMRGFKSFADTTTLEFEPGVTAVVGPNGSGKSNVVDAVAWVLGAQSTRLLRSSRMDDVIFAGTAQRAALGRAEVALTLDNSTGRLPIDGAEVTVSRTLFRNGESEYAINGTTCRLLDVQELLGDSGVGRQQHMIIGQGQLDSILSSNPENRRAVIEEAAGVLKHRRRKERSERRLAATQENLERLGDLVREVRRQMRPLERQAASARTVAGVEAELRAARATLFAARLARYGRRLGELDAALATSAQRERELRAELVALDAQATTAAAEMGSRREETLAGSLATVRSLLERARGLTSVIDERRRALDQALAASADENVIANLEADAAHLAEDLIALAEGEAELDALRARAGDARAALEAAQAALEAHGEVSGALAEESLRGAREQVALLERAVGDARERERRVRDELDAERARLDEVEAALARARAAAGEVADRLEGARAQRAAAQGEVDAGEALLGALEVELAALRARADGAREALEAARAAFEAHGEVSGAGGRAILGGLEGVLGAFLDLIEVDAGYERAVESAAGASVGAMVVEGRASARQALAALRREGGAGLILAVAEGEITAVVAPTGCRALRERVRARAGAPAHVERVLDALFARAVVAPGWEAGVEVAIEHPDLVVVTDEGDRFAASGWRVASGRAVVTRQTVEEAADAARAAGALVEPAREARESAAAALARARAALTGAARELAEADAMSERIAADAARLEEERDTARRRVEDLGVEADGLLERVSALEVDLLTRRATLPALEADLADLAERVEARRGAEARVAAARADAEALFAELTAREAELIERRRLIEARRDEVERRLEGRATEREAATRRRVALEADRDALERLRAVAERCARETREAHGSLEATYREQLEATRARAGLLEDVRARRAQTDEKLRVLGEQRRDQEVERAEVSLMVQTVHDAVRHELAVEVEALEPVDETALDLATLESRVGELEARITSMGPINPLALEELASLEERYAELDAQVSDVRHARRELQEVLRALDEEIMETFTSAYADVNEHFSSLIAMLFPGGQGRLTLSDPDDPLNTGVEIEVRPMGRNVRRISLLSGGERSMAALAFLFAVFRSRPSPFYLMDEVEAALDDVNLQRFLTLVDEFRDEAQLIIVTHQKRTMESADALYGVTMVPGASSKVVSQRVTRAPEVAAS